MVAIVTGNGLGLANGSLGILGGQGSIGHALQGQLGEAIVVNGATGNVVVSHQDEVLTGKGLDLGLTRTYNSGGGWDGDNNDSWRLGIYRRVTTLTGSLSTAGSTIQKTEADGSVTTFSWDTGRSAYVSTSGGGAFDTLSYNSSTLRWTFTDGTTRSSETYDWVGGSGKLLSEADVDGNSISYTYTGSLITQITTASTYSATVEKINLSYSNGLLTQVSTSISDDGVATRTSTRVYYSYDASNRLASVITDLSPDDNVKTDGKVYTVSYTYYASGDAGYTAASLGKLRTLTQSDGSVLTLTYDASGRVASVKDGLNRVTSFDYSVANQVKVTDAAGQLTTLTYDTTADKKLTQVKDVQNNTLSYAYTANGDLASITDARGKTISYEYDSNGNRTLERDALGNTVKYVYGTSNQLLSLTRYTVPDADGAGAGTASGATETRYVYDAENHLRFEISDNGRVSEHVYNSVGQKIATLAHGGRYTTSGTPTEANLVAWRGTVDLTDSVRTDYSYDFRGNVKTAVQYGAVDSAGNGVVADAATTTTTFTYSASGQLLKTIDGLSKTTLYAYDGLGRLISSTNALNEVTASAYDDAGRKITASYANGRKVVSLYDVAGQLTSVMESDSGGLSNLGTTRYYYDALGRERLRVDATGQKTYTLYDTAGRKNGSIDSAGRLTRFSYTANGQLYQTYQFANPVAATLFVAGGAGSLLLADGTPSALLLGTATLASVQPATDLESTLGTGDHEQDSWNHIFYDEAGRVGKTVDRAGYVTELFYDGLNRVIKTVRYSTPTSTTPLPSTLFASGIAVTATPATDRMTRTLYDLDGLKRAELDAEGYVTAYAYDDQFRLIRTERYATALAVELRETATLSTATPAADAINDQKSYVYYNGLGQVAGTVDAQGYLSTLSYDKAGRVLTQKRYATAVSASSSSVLSTLVAAAGVATTQTMSYDALGRVLTVTGADGTVTKNVYNSGGQLSSTTVALGAVESHSVARTTSYTYELDGQLKTTTQAEGGVTTATYDAAGRLLKRVQQLTSSVNATTLYYYATGFDAVANGQRQYSYEIDALGFVTRTALNALGQVTETRRSAAAISSANLALLTTEGGGFVSSTLTTALSGLFSDANDTRTRTSYTVNGLVAAVQDAFNYSTSFSYDAFGQVTQRTAALGDLGANTLITSFSYDRRGSLLKTIADNVTGGLKLTTQSSYDAFGRVVSSTDAAGVVRTSTYDRLGRVLSLTGSVANTQSMSYDAWGRVLTQTDALGRITTLAYDDVTRKTTVTSPEGVVTETLKTRHGQTLSITVKESGNDKTTTYSYDKNGNLKKTVLADGSTHIDADYDLANRVIARYEATTATTGLKTSYSYDAIGRVLTQTVDAGGLNIVTTTTYSSSGATVVSSTSGGVSTQTTYDAGGRAIKIKVGSSPNESLTVISYDAAGRQLSVVEGMDSGGANALKTTVYVYDKLGRRITETVKNADNEAGTGTVDLVTSYVYDKNGNVIAKTDANGRVTRFVYDTENRLVYTVNPLGAVSESSYDATGRVIKTRAYATVIATGSLPALTVPLLPSDISSRVTADAVRDGVQEQAYDRDGRLVATLDSRRQLTRLEYDTAGNVVRQTRYYTALGAGLPLTYTTTVASHAADQVTRTVYNALNRAVYSIDALNYVTRTDYDAAGRVALVRRYASNVGVPSGLPTRAAMLSWGTGLACRNTYQTYDSAGRLKYTVDSENFVTETVYVAGQNVVASTTRYANATQAASLTTADITADLAVAGRRDTTRDQTTTFYYDGAGRLKQQQDALGNSEFYTYTRLGLKATLRNKLGLTWTYEYDAAGRLVKETTPPVDVVLYTTNLNQSANSGTYSIETVYRYDGAGNLRYRTEAANVPSQARTTQYQYNAAGQQTSTVLPTVNVDGNSKHVDDDAFGGLTLVRADAGFETAATPTTQVQYDAFGNAVVNRDVMGVYSYKAYDNLNRVRYEIDGEGYVTEHDYDAFSNEIKLTRYSQRYTVGTAGVPITEATLNSVYDTLVDARKRTISKSYDASNRLTQVKEDSLYHVDGDAAAGTVTGATFQKSTTSSYNAFGEVIKQAVTLNSGGSNTVDSYSYYDERGKKIADVNGEGYLTTYSYDAFGNLTRQTDYAQKLPSGWSTTSYGTATPHALDRQVDSAYDRMNQKLSDTRKSVDYHTASGLTETPVTGDVVTSYAYDKVGNQIKITDALNNITRQYYDALGRQRATITPGRQANGSTINPLTEHQFDAFGNIVRTYSYSTGIAAASINDTAWTYTPPAQVATADRQVIHVYDLASREIITQQVDGSGLGRHIVMHKAYDALGRVTKDWTGNTDALGNANNSVHGFKYDKVGRQVGTLTRTKTKSVDSVGKDLRLVGANLAYHTSNVINNQVGYGTSTSSLTLTVNYSPLKPWGMTEYWVEVGYTLGTSSTVQYASHTVSADSTSKQIQMQNVTGSSTDSAIHLVSVRVKGRVDGKDTVLPLGQGSANLRYEPSATITAPVTYGGTYSTTLKANLVYSDLSRFAQDSYRVVISYTKDLDGAYGGGPATVYTASYALPVGGGSPTFTLGTPLTTSTAPNLSNFKLTSVVIKGTKAGVETDVLGGTQEAYVGSAATENSASQQLVWNKSSASINAPVVRYKAVGAAWSTATLRTAVSSGAYWTLDFSGSTLGAQDVEILYTRPGESTPYARTLGVFNPTTGTSTISEVSGDETDSVVSYQMGISQERSVYNAFGEITDKALFAHGADVPDVGTIIGYGYGGIPIYSSSVQSEAHAHYDFDQAGRIWRSQENGVWTVYYYNTLGQAVAQVKSATQVLGTVATDAASFATTIGLTSPGSVNATYQRSYTWSNKLGQVVRQQQAAYNASTTGAIASSSVFAADSMPISGTGQLSDVDTVSGYGTPTYVYNDGIQLNWTSVRSGLDAAADLDKIKVVYSYRYNNGTEQSATELDLDPSTTSLSKVLRTGDSATLSLPNMPSSKYTVTGIKVYAKLAGSNTYQSTPLRDLAVPSRRLSFAKPADTDRALFRYRSGSSGAWSQLFVDITPDGSRYFIDLSARAGLVSGASYQFQLFYYGDNVNVPTDPNSLNVVLRAVSSTYGSFTAGSAGSASGVTGAPVSDVIRPISTQTLDRWGNVTQTVNALGEVSSNVYDDNNQLIESRSAVTTVLNSAGVATQEALVTQVFYDRLGRKIGVKDAESVRNNLGLQRAWTYDAAGDQISEEVAGAGGARTLHYYNAFGEKVRTTDPLYAQNTNRAINYSYDSFGRLVQQKRASGTTESYVYDALGQRIETHNWLQATTSSTGVEALTLQQDYDAFGRVIRSSRHHYTNLSITTNQAHSARTRYNYATLSGTLGIKVWGSGLESDTEYDLFGRKVREYNGAGDEMSWHYNADGQLISHKDLGGVTTTYAYNQDGTLKTQTNNRSSIEGRTSQSLAYSYDEAGRQTQITDNVVAGRTQRFRYDALGRQVVSIFADGASTTRVQTEYDALGRLLNVVAGDGAHVDYAYDANGNRRRTRMNYRDPAAGSTGYLGREYWYSYDRADRMTFGQGVLKNGQITSAGKQTETIRTLAGSGSGGAYYSVTTREIQMPQGIEVSYDAAGQRKTAYSMTTADKWQYESYSYDADGRLLNINRKLDSDNVLDTTVTGLQLLSSRTYDKANRITRQDSYDSAGVRTDYRTNTFDASSRTVQQQVYDNADKRTAEMKWTFEASGITRSYTMQTFTGQTYTNTYTYDYRKFDSYRESRVLGTSTYYQNGRTDETYDHNGNLTLVDDATEHSRDRAMTYDLAGRIVKKVSGSKTQNYLYAEGAERASYGNLDSIDVDEGYSPIADTSVGTTAGNYVVTGGESLQNIATSTWGDASLWYLIAEANGLSGGAALQPGQSLVIPNRIANTRNSSDVVKPYNPSAIIGDTTPNLANPPPPSKGGCGVIGMIIMIVVAVVVTIFTAGAALGLLVPAAAGVSGGIMATGAAVLAGTASVASAGMMMAAAAIGAAVGSIASQVVGLATGNVEKFSWKQVGISALSAGVTAGAGAALGGAGSAVSSSIGGTTGQVAGAMTTATINNVVGQGLMMAVGAQDKFDWRSTATAAVGAGLTAGIGQKVADTDTFMTKVGKEFVNGAINRSVQLAVYREGKMNWINIAADAFGNVLANDIAPNTKANTWQHNAVRMGVKSVTNYLGNRLNGQDSGDAWRSGLGRALAQEGADFIGDNSRGSADTLGAEGGYMHALAHAGLGAMVAGVEGKDVGAGAIGGFAGAMGQNFAEAFANLGVEGTSTLKGFNNQLTMKMVTLLGQGIAERSGNDLNVAAEAAGNVEQFNSGDHREWKDGKLVRTSSDENGWSSWIAKKWNAAGQVIYNTVRYGMFKNDEELEAWGAGLKAAKAKDGTAGIADYVRANGAGGGYLKEGVALAVTAGASGFTKAALAGAESRVGAGAATTEANLLKNAAVSLVERKIADRVIMTSEEVMEAAIVNGPEVVKGFVIDGTKQMVEQTMQRDILRIATEAGKGKGSIRALLNGFESDALKAGATSIRIVGHEIQNKTFFTNSAIAKKLGYTFTQIDKKTFELIKNL